MHAQMEATLRSIRESRKILDLRNDWDGANSPAYLESTWRRAALFVLRQAAIVARMGLPPPAPSIQPGPWGCIDIHWNLPDRELLLVIDVRADRPANYYGTNHKGVTIKGHLDPARPHPWLILWLIADFPAS